MYQEFFGLKEKPFSMTPDTEFFYRHVGHQEALNVLLVALRNGEGFVRVIGEVGTGKTLICRKLLKMLQDDYTTAYLPTPLFTPHELYQAILSEICSTVPENASLQQMHQRLLEELIRLRDQNRPLVILIDEAQAMPFETLEALRLLSNLETEKEKLLHIFFFAQPEFEERLARHDLRQLRQRISDSYTLQTLQEDELGPYLEHRLRVAGYRGEPVFQPAALKVLNRASKGVPRLLNLLAHKSLLAAYGKGVKKIDRRLAKLAVWDTLGEDEALQRPFLHPYLIEFGAVVIIAVATVWILTRWLP